MLRLEVRQRTLLLDHREFVFVVEDGTEVERTDTEGVVRRVERWVARHLRGSARVHGRAQLLQALRQFNSPKEGLTQFVAVEAPTAARLAGLVEPARRAALDEAVVRAIQARHPVDLLSVERWVRGHGQWIGLTGKNQALGGKVRLATEGIRSDFEPEKLLARSLLDKPEAFRGETLRLLVVDDPFVDAVTGDGAFLLRASAPRDCTRPHASWPDLTRDLAQVQAVHVEADGKSYRLRTDLFGHAQAAFAADGVRPPSIATLLGSAPPPADDAQDPGM